ncbi:universal stress protein [Arenibacter sp. GZD96]|uniref:universal stress protein n=1 Tax=Aurantibrevibacter litoralis TaxID=3106030 RepID=UPI002AFFBB27|nr:universal stress protein [Arenibacter sp. GZD-96]MEA1785189.1 universal stress protein [Arenibacter sp. GZD-96]
MSIKKIILPTDFSENALNAIRYALQLYKNDSCMFFLLHTYTPAIYQAEYVVHSPGQIGLGDPRQMQVEAQLVALQGQLVQEFNNPKHTFVRHAAFNVFVGEVLETIKNEAVELVIMGTKGATGAKEILFGTNTVHLIQKAKVPIIAVPRMEEYTLPKNILFPTDYEVSYQKTALQEFLQIAQANNAKIHVLHMTSPKGLTAVQQANKANLEFILEPYISQFHDDPDETVIGGINAFLSKNKMDMLVMLQNKHTFLEKLFIEPTIKKIGFHVHIPFMVIPFIDHNSA